MADDEQFSLCWNNFNSNLSAGFHESLCRGDLVDVTLAAEGQFVKAHRLVLSVCSPYFRKMFTQMPANQHAFVFLKDVSHTALKDLIQFMYCGEVNVKQEALPAFISTAEALQIKGLTDSDPPPSQSPAEPSTPTPQMQQISPRVRQRTSTSRSFKIESVEDSGDDNKQTQIVIQTTSAPPAQQVIAQSIGQTQHLQQTQSQTHIAPQQIANTTTATTTTVVTHKRPARTIGSGPHIKRTKSTIDPLDTSDASTGVQQITVQTAVAAAPAPETKAQVQQNEPEYIDLPIELPTKSEPDYAEDAGDVEGGENEATYVEDDSYGELRYDESYFTENDEAPTGAATGQGSAGGANATTSKALVKQQQASFADTSYVDVADQANSDAQDSPTNLDINAESIGPLKYNYRGQIVHNGHTYYMHAKNGSTCVVHWRCSAYAKFRCRANIKTRVKKRKPNISGNNIICRMSTSVGDSNQQQRQSKQKTVATKAVDKSSIIYTVDGMPVIKSSYSEIKTGETVLKTSWNRHKLTKISKPRMRGKCVHCLKKAPGDQIGLSRITTYCPQCPGGVWMCLDCFDEVH